MQTAVDQGAEGGTQSLRYSRARDLEDHKKHRLKFRTVFRRRVTRTIFGGSVQRDGGIHELQDVVTVEGGRMNSDTLMNLPTATKLETTHATTNFILRDDRTPSD